MPDKIKNLLTKDSLERLRDVRVLGQLVFAVLVLMVSWSGVKVIQTNYGLQKQISTLQQQNNVQKLQNDNLRLKNQYYNTDEYLELAARRQFGKAAPGETELLVPKNVALAYTIDTSPPPQKPKAPTPQSTYQKNFRGWMNFFMHRPSSDG